MARPRASASAPRGAPRDSSRAASRTTIASFAGCAGGGGLAAFAQTLPAPLGRLLILAAPTISVLVARYGPTVLDLLAHLIRHSGDAAKHHYAIHQLRKFLKVLKAQLGDQDLTPDRRAEIQRLIATTESSIDNRMYRWVEPYLIGDNVTGLRVATSDEADVAERTQPPEGAGGAV
jgi:hypothetical protein